MKKGFSLVEILVVVVILALLIFAVISTLNPIEQINKGIDSSILQTAVAVSRASNRYVATQGVLPWEGSVATEELSRESNLTGIYKLVDTAEVKDSFPQLNSNNMSKIFLTKEDGTTDIHLCFNPRSKAFSHHQNTVFNQDGSFKMECLTNDSNCWFCLGDYNDMEDYLEELDTEEEMATEEQCTPFNPEFPNFAWTCNYSDTFSQYSCTNYCVGDRGCNDGYCPAGERHLVKSYYGTGDNFSACAAHIWDVQVDYCVPEPYSRCNIKSNGSRPSDFVWGCVNPRRPWKWIE